MKKVLGLFTGKSHVSVNIILKIKVQKLGQAIALSCIVRQGSRSSGLLYKPSLTDD